MRLSVHPLARAETLDAAEFYDSKRTGLGRSFIESIDASVSSVLQDPARLPIVDGDVWRIAVRGFPYDVCFRASSDELRILTFIHYHRASDHWQLRR